MALLLWLALLSRLRAGAEDAQDWPEGMHPQNNAPASFKEIFPDVFLALPDALFNATGGFTEEERDKAGLQWAYSPKKDMAATSSVLQEIVPGKSHSYIVSRYKSGLETKIANKEAIAAEKEKKKLEKAASAKHKPAATSKPKSVAKPAAKKPKTAAAAAVSVAPQVSLSRQHSAIASGAVSVPEKRQRVAKVFYD